MALHTDVPVCLKKEGHMNLSCLQDLSNTRFQASKDTAPHTRTQNFGRAFIIKCSSSHHPTYNIPTIDPETEESVDS